MRSLPILQSAWQAQRPRRSSGLRPLQQLTDRGLGLASVGAPEEIGVVEKVIQVVEVLALPMANRTGPGGVVAIEEGRRKTTEQRRHRQIHFTVSPMHRRVEDRGAVPWQQTGIAGPEIAMHQRRHRLVTVQPVDNAGQQRL